MVVKIFQKYVEAHALHTPATWEWIVIAVLYAVYLTDFIVTVAVIQGLNKKLTRLDKVRSDLRIVSDKLSDTLATTTIGTDQQVDVYKRQHPDHLGRERSYTLESYWKSGACETDSDEYFV